jgi:acetate kinase
VIEHDLAETPVDAVGHRIVHGGAAFDTPVLIDGAVIEKLTALIPFAPAHQPHNLAGIRVIAERRPNLPQIACFDTAFHRTVPRLAQLFPIPRALSDSGLIRYGFHGLSYAHVAETLPALNGGAMPRRVLAAHLGNGASLCAMLDGRSIATTMGLTALDGLMMGARSGAVDPGLVLHLIEERGMTPAAVNHLLNCESGLLGVSGISADVRTLEVSGHAFAAEALELFAYRAAREAGSLVSALGGLDALVFTGGIGEHSARTRSRICAYLAFLDVKLDDVRNTAHMENIAAADAPPVFIIPANEELPIARAARSLAR